MSTCRRRAECDIEFDRLPAAIAPTIHKTQKSVYIPMYAMHHVRRWRVFVCRPYACMCFRCIWRKWDNFHCQRPFRTPSSLRWVTMPQCCAPQHKFNIIYIWLYHSLKTYLLSVSAAVVVVVLLGFFYCIWRAVLTPRVSHRVLRFPFWWAKKARDYFIGRSVCVREIECECGCADGFGGCCWRPKVQSTRIRGVEWSTPNWRECIN